MFTSVPRVVHGVIVMLEVAEGRGLPRDVALRGTGIREQDLGPDGQVTRDQEILLASSIVRHLGDEIGLGAEVGVHFTLETFGVWGYALGTSHDLRAALEIGEKFLELTYAFTRVSLEEEGDEARLYYDASHLPRPIRRFALERDGIASRLLERQLLGRLMPLRSIESVAEGTDEEAELLGELLQARVSFNRPRTFAAFDRSLLDLPVLGHDPSLTGPAVAQCEEVLTQRRAMVGYAGAVRSALLASAGSWSDIASIAAAMHVSERTLQRRLIDEGTSFRELVAATREGLAVELLQTGMPVAEVARRVGYVEVSSFSQAFYRWRGVRPSAYRAQGPADEWVAASGSARGDRSGVAGTP